jgi:Zn-finger nucleic acid-binding protein
VTGPFRKDDDPNDAPPPDEFRTWLSDRACPACGIPMYTGRMKQAGLDACGGCGGVWVSDVDAKYLLASNDSAFAAMAAAAVKGSEKRTQQTARRTCPDCRTTLAQGYLQMGGITVDVCKMHGTWFDAFELEALTRYLTKQALTAAAIDTYAVRDARFETPFVAFVRRVLDSVRRAVSGS